MTDLERAILRIRQAKNAVLKSNPFCERARFSLPDVIAVVEFAEGELKKQKGQPWKEKHMRWWNDDRWARNYKAAE